jgi:hypothetical protein
MHLLTDLDAKLISQAKEIERAILTGDENEVRAALKRMRTLSNEWRRIYLPELFDKTQPRLKPALQEIWKAREEEERRKHERILALRRKAGRSTDED